MNNSKTEKKEQNYVRGLVKIANQYERLNFEEINLKHQQFTYRLNKRLPGIDRAAMHENEMYAVDLTARYYRIKLGKTNHDEIISNWRKEGSEIKYLRNWNNDRI